MGFLRISPEFLVNSTTANSQFDSKIAELSDGRFIVTWTHFSSGVRAQIFTSAGAKSGEEFLVKASASVADVTALAEGRFVVTWQDFDGGGDTSSSAVRGQIFAANGVASGGEFLVNTTTTNRQSDNTVTTLEDGRFVATWTDTSQTGGDTSGSAVRGQIFTANGAKSGGEFLVNTTTVSPQDENTVTALADGRFVVTWTDTSQTGGDTSDSAVRGQIFTANGAKSGGEFLVNTTTVSSQDESTVTALADGRFVVTWTDDSQTGADISNSAVRGQIFTTNGAKSGGEFLVNTTTASLQLNSSVTALTDGRFVVTWGDSSQTSGDNSSFAVQGQVFAANGARSGGEFLINSTTANQQTQSIVRALADGRFVVTWSDSSQTGGDTSGSAVRGQIFDPTSYVGGFASEIVIGGSLADTFDGGGGGDALFGEGGNDTLVGGAGSDSLYGGEGNDSLNSAGGGDLMDGGAGNDTYLLNSDDIIVEAAGKGADRLFLYNGGFYQLAAGVSIETMELWAGAGAASLTGNELAQTLIGNAAANVLTGKGGNDTYIIDNAGDVVDESVAGSTGVDTVRSSVRSIFLGDTVHFKGAIEQAALDGASAFNLTGNSLNNYLQGNSAANTLNGVAGADTMRGLGGNDTYVIDNAGDVADESVAGSTGVDTIRSSVRSIFLGDIVHFKGAIEQAALDGASAFNLTGNGLNNYLQGNSAANTLNGVAGADTMRGLGGNDTYVIDNAGDVVDEGAAGSTGVDTVRSSNLSINLFDTAHYKGAIEQAALDGTLALNAVGNGLNNYLQGNSAANGLNGGIGSDTMKGNGGADRFFFTTALGPTNIDTINDFAIDDTIYLAKAIFSGIAATGTLAAAAFAKNTTGLAGDATDRIIYETDTGKLFYDADGLGGSVGSVHFATLPVGLALTSADFVVT